MSRRRSGLAWAVAFIILAVVSTRQTAGTEPGRSGADPVTGSALRIARSGDGLEFRDAGLFAENASSPALLRLSTGQTLAVFDQVGGGLCFCQSRDNGATWSAAHPIRWSPTGREPSAPLHGSLVQLSPRLVRVYFLVRDARGGEDARPFIASAVTRNGRDYQLDRQVRIDCRGMSDPRPVAVRVGALIHLFITPTTTASASEGSGRVLHLVSRDGRGFRPAPEAPPRVSPHSVVETGNGMLRLYAANEEGVISATVAPEREWQQEAGLRLRGGSQPAVCSAADGFIMLYAVPANAARREPAVVQVPAVAAESVAGNRPGEGEAGGDRGGWGAFAAVPPAGAPASTSDQRADALLEQAAAVPGGTGSAATIELAPMPDGQDPVDYHAWVLQQFPAPAEGNAYDAYAQILRTPEDYLSPKPGWPEKVEDLFNGDYSGPPFGWDPQKYPNWEASNQGMRTLLDTFRHIGQMDVYADRLKFSAKQIAEAPDGRPALADILLPYLADHRKLAWATLADGWRAEGGQVSPDRMLADIETTLRTAGHLQQDCVLISRLVGGAEQGAAEASSRQALAQVPFTPEQLETGLRMLQEYDRGPADPAGYLPGESAFVMDLAQRLLEPPSTGEMLQSTFGFILSAAAPPHAESDFVRRFRNMNLSQQEVLEAAQAAQSCLREYADLLRSGYPEVRKAQIQEMAKKYANTNRLTKEILAPDDYFALGRVYAIQARHEAGRRGTQLTWAVNLFRARNGRWPSSLDELPADGSNMRTDPFTGRDFVYRLTPSGPTIYSESENGKDDGGVHSSRWDDEESVKATGGSDDYVFWPPQPK